MPDHTEKECLEGIWGTLESIENQLNHLHTQMDAHYDVLDRIAKACEAIAAKE